MSFQYRPPLPLLSNLEKISSNFSCTVQARPLIFVRRNSWAADSSHDNCAGFYCETAKFPCLYPITLGCDFATL